MKIIIEYDDEEQALTAIRGWRFEAKIDEVREYLRGRLKHEDLSEDVYKALDEVRSRLFSDDY